MQTSHEPSSNPPTRDTIGRPTDSAARKAGLFLLLTAAATVVAVIGRVSAGADQQTLAESLAAIAESSVSYGIGGAARFISGITLMVGAWFLLRTWIIKERRGTPLVPALFVVSGVFTALSGACAVALAACAPEIAGDIATPIETISYLRWLTGKIGFTAAGLGLIVAARYQWKAGGTLRYISLGSAAIGIVMQFIWVDAATVMHPISGAAFFGWLVVIGGLFLTGRMERAFGHGA